MQVHFKNFIIAYISFFLVGFFLLVLIRPPPLMSYVRDMTGVTEKNTSHLPIQQARSAKTAELNRFVAAAEVSSTTPSPTPEQQPKSLENVPPATKIPENEVASYKSYFHSRLSSKVRMTCAWNLFIDYTFAYMIVDDLRLKYVPGVDANLITLLHPCFAVLCVYFLVTSLKEVPHGHKGGGGHHSAHHQRQQKHHRRHGDEQDNDEETTPREELKVIMQQQQQQREEGHETTNNNAQHDDESNEAGSTVTVDKKNDDNHTNLVNRKSPSTHQQLNNHNNSAFSVVSPSNNNNNTRNHQRIGSLQMSSVSSSPIAAISVPVSVTSPSTTGMSKPTTTTSHMRQLSTSTGALNLNNIDGMMMGPSSSSSSNLNKMMYASSSPVPATTSSPAKEVLNPTTTTQEEPSMIRMVGGSSPSTSGILAIPEDPNDDINNNDFETSQMISKDNNNNNTSGFRVIQDPKRLRYAAICLLLRNFIDNVDGVLARQQRKLGIPKTGVLKDVDGHVMDATADTIGAGMCLGACVFVLFRLRVVVSPPVSRFLTRIGICIHRRDPVLFGKVVAFTGILLSIAVTGGFWDSFVARYSLLFEPFVVRYAADLVPLENSMPVRISMYLWSCVCGDSILLLVVWAMYFNLLWEAAQYMFFVFWPSMLSICVYAFVVWNGVVLKNPVANALDGVPTDCQL